MKPQPLTALIIGAAVALSACCSAKNAQISGAEPAAIQETGGTVATLSELREYEFTTREIPLSNGGQKIYGVAYIPARAKSPLVIISHGLGGSYRSNTAYAEQLARHGIAAYIFDFRGGGGTMSDGSTTQMSVMTEVSDLETVLSAARSWDFADAEKIVLFGTSQGGAVSAITAARHAGEVSGAALFYPAFLVHDAVHEQFSSLSEVPDKYQFNWIRAGRAYAADVWDYDVYAEIGAFKKPVLLLHGDADTIVPVSYSERACAVYDSEEYHIIKGAGHGFRGAAFDEACAYLFAWLGKIGMITE